jgi:hypothetical protein
MAPKEVDHPLELIVVLSRVGEKGPARWPSSPKTTPSWNLRDPSIREPAARAGREQARKLS